ncbi:patatin-like phospholipase family protein [Dechloromonas denitrificans]|uniref:patatin-like phospholipase family protein n=1 Tax=Dechloromonas denitrificans TaxID=281362 RepID=UPI0039AFA047|nr:patatin-like phospholipase family protein [Dechloromonas denitrificans]
MVMTPADSAPGLGEGEMLQCDLIMKGGITSGVVYPRLIARLAEKYRFRNIGGTSAGAIAAAGCAAAEYGRQHNNHGAFDRLRELPDDLQQSMGSPQASMLFHLFQPAPEVTKHFAVLVSMLNLGPLHAVGSALLTMLRQFRGFALLGLVLALLLIVPIVSVTGPYPDTGGAIFVSLVILAGWALWSYFGLRRLRNLSAGTFLLWLVAAIAFTALVLVLLGGAPLDWRLPFLVGAVAIAAVLSAAVALGIAGAKFVKTLLAGIHKNFYGICTGRTMNKEQIGPKGLTDWLMAYFNELAGLKLEDRVLTFGDLWGANEASKTNGAARDINLEVMTTAISQQMCYSIPFRDGCPPFYYDEDEWSRLFPAEAMRALREPYRAEGAKDDDRRDPDEPEEHVANAAGKRLRRLPRNQYLPVVVAVRMSLSFPILLSAVSLYSVDWSLKANSKAKEQASSGSTTVAGRAPGVLTATRVWFSDGGIGSNMPLHFFDAPLPGHPTFAVNLKEPHPDHPIDEGGRIYLPDSNIGGRIRYWPEPQDAKPMSGLVGFLLAIINTMQNWRDEIQFPYPGYRDRIVQISQRKDEGGLNLNMPEQNIRALSEAGEMAAEALIARFHPSGAQAGEGWANHEEVRLTTFMGLLERMGVSLNARLHSGTWSSVTQRVVTGRRYTISDGKAATDYLARLQDMGDTMIANGSKLQGKALKPHADLRISPKI